MVELAKAYVQIVPSLKGAQSTIQKELGGTANSTGKSIGSRLGNGIVSTVASTMKAGMVTTGVAAGGVLTTALTKGFKRLNAFEQARKSLEGLKLSAEQIDVVMSNANASVDGTAFGLDAAATAAKGLVAAGVEPGEDLERVLTLIGDSAAQSGSSMEEMGVIWGKVAAKGKLQGDDAMQMLERGIPIYQMVAGEMGVTAEEAMNLASKGEVSFEIFADAMEKSFGGSALALGDTVSGSFDNVGAALGRLGQGILAGPFADLPALFTRVKDEINKVIPTVTRVSDKAYKSLKGTFEILSGRNVSMNLIDVFGRDAGAVTDALRDLRENAKTAKDAFSDFGQAVARELKPLTSATMRDVVTVFARLGELGTTVARGVADVGVALSPVVGYLVEAGAVLGGGALLSIERLAPEFFELAEAVANAAVPLSGLMVPATESMVAVAVPLADAIANVAEFASKLSTPILVAAGAFVALKTGIGPIPSVLGKLTSASVASGMETLGLKSLYASDALRGVANGATGMQAGFAVAGTAVKRFGGVLKTALVTNAPMLALSALIGVIGSFAQKNQEARDYVRDLADSFHELTGKATSATEEIIIAKASEEGWLDTAKTAGVETDILTAALMGNKDARAQLESEIQRVRNAEVSYREETDTATTVTVEQKDAVEALSHILQHQDGVMSDARAEQQKLNDAKTQAIDLTSGQLEKEQELANFYKSQHDALFRYHDALDRLHDAEERGNEIAANTESSIRDRDAALRDYSKSVLDAAEAAVENKESQAEVNRILSEGAENVRLLGEEWGASSEMVDTYAGQLENIDPNLEFNVDANTDPAMFQLDEFVVTLDKTKGEIDINGVTVPAETTVEQFRNLVKDDPAMVDLLADAKDANQTLDSYLAQVASSHSYVTIDGNKVRAENAVRAVETKIKQGHEYITIDGNKVKAENAIEAAKRSVRNARPTMPVGATDNTADAVGEIVRSINRKSATIKVGVTAGSAALAALRLSSANGNIFDYYADGGVRERHVAQIAPAGAWRVWAEPETGGEAYIPLAVSKRQRSTQILEEVANRFGYRLAQYANGGVSGGAPSGSMWPSSMRLVVGEREFTAFMDERVDANRAVSAVSDFVNNGARYRAQMGR